MKTTSLYQKLFVYFLTVIILSLATVGIFSYRTSSAELDELTENQMAQIVGNAVYHTDLYLNDYDRSLVSLLTNRQVKEFLALTRYSEAYDYYDLRKLVREVGADPLFIQYPKIACLYMIGPDDNAAYYFNKVEELSFTEEAVRSQREFLMGHTKPDGSVSILNHTIQTGQENRMITLVRRVRGLSSPELNGLLAIEMRSSDLSALWSGIELGLGGYFLIMDDNGRYLYNPDGGKVGEAVPAGFRERILQSGNSPFLDTVDGVERMFMAKKSGVTDWALVVSMPLAELRKPVSNIRSTTIWVGVFTLLAAILLAYRFGKSITNPIQVLKKSMRETEKGNWTPIPVPKRRDEIAELMQRYNVMIKRLSDAVDRVVQVELKNQQFEMERQRAEFQSLQLQINPHFMYNTLETIVCYAAIKESDEISEIVRALSYMLRYSVRTNVEEITLANELKHVMYFMMVLKHRIGREFEIEVDVKPRYLLYKMVRLTLQPLVENIFQHAFPDGIEDYHFIRIDAGECEDGFWIRVEDNGCGIPEDRLGMLRERLSTRLLTDSVEEEAGQKGGIGLLNVHRRIQMVFGEEYGLRIESTEQHGTRMTMWMPAPAAGQRNPGRDDTLGEKSVV